MTLSAVLTPETTRFPDAPADNDVWGNYISEELYWEKYYERGDISFEWNNGQLERMPMTDYIKYVMYLWFQDILRDYLKVHPIAKMVGLELGFRLVLPTKTTIRKPDMGLVLNNNPIKLGDYDRSYHGTFDLCIESLSDSRQSEIDRDAIIKRAEYAAVGVQEYYLLDERGIETQFYALNAHGVYQPILQSDGVVRSQVLPGFQFRVQDLYDQPTPPEMVDDPVYSGFISPLYRAERQRAQQEHQRAQQEHQRAEDAEARAAHYKELLKAAGLLPPEQA
ncbi:MAG: Uma2 family endonuclease [Caldilineaceae bacterium]